MVKGQVLAWWPSRKMSKVESSPGPPVIIMIIVALCPVITAQERGGGIKRERERERGRGERE